MLHPDSNVIDRLDGPVAVARLCQIRPQAVSQWRHRGIPAARRMYLQLVRPEAFSQAAGTAERAEPQAA